MGTGVEGRIQGWICKNAKWCLMSGSCFLGDESACTRNNFRTEGTGCQEVLNYVALTNRPRGKIAATPGGFLEEVGVAGSLGFGQVEQRHRDRQQGDHLIRQERLPGYHSNISACELTPSIHVLAKLLLCARPCTKL